MASRAVSIIQAIAGGFSHLIAPRVCHVCGQSLIANEDIMCLSCKLEIPRTGIHHDNFNEIHRRLGHHYPVDRAAGWFYYRKTSSYAQLLIDSKYSSLPSIDRKLGEMCAEELAADHFFDNIDLLVPMPMFWVKRLLRGYNQAEEICKGISIATGINYECALRAVGAHGIQARHNKAQRHQSIANTMAVSDQQAIRGRNILLVDDIITSGASCMEALRALSTAAPSTVSILALGLTAQA